MPLLKFTKLTNQVRSYSKQQTIRKPRKNPLKQADILHIYTQEKLGKARIKSIERKKLKDITLNDAIRDGFSSIEECLKCIMEMHKCSLDEYFDVITFHPEFKEHSSSVDNWMNFLIDCIEKMLTEEN